VSGRKVSWVYVPVALSVALIVLTLAGCASVPEFNAGAEIGFQALHAIDVAQTYHGAAEDRCYAEGDAVTRALIGSKPRKGAVLAWGAGYGAAHYGITRLLEAAGWERAAAMWELVSIADTAAVVGRNYSIGVRIGRPNSDYPGCGGRSAEIVLAIRR
jgi:hypothetical protein